MSSLSHLPQPFELTECGSIIFVHGLTGGREKTWTAKGAEGSWPEMLLPQIVPRSRILTYGYDADVVRLLSVVSKARLGNHAEGLLEAVASHRESDSTVRS